MNTTHLVYDIVVLSNMSDDELSNVIGLPVPNETNDWLPSTAVLATAVVNLFICGIGILGNLIAISILFATKDFRRSSSSWYVLQLAIGNTLFLVTLPFNATANLRGEWIFSTNMCKAKEAMLFLNYYASILFLTILSVDRYLTVRCVRVKSTEKKRRMTSYIVTIATWIASLLLCVPIILYSAKLIGAPNGCYCGSNFPNPSKLTGENFCIAHNFTSPEELTDCLTWAPGDMICHDDKEVPGQQQILKFDDTSSENHSSYEDLYNWSGDIDLDLESYDAIPSFELSNDTEDEILYDTMIPGCHYDHIGEPFRAFIWINFVVMFLLPFLIMSCTYVAIMIRLQNPDLIDQEGSVTSDAATSTASSQRRGKTQTRIVVMCGLYVVVFVICWLPFHATYVAKLVGIQTDSSSLCTNLSKATTTLAFLHSAINPFLYIFARGTEKIRKIFRKGRRRVIQTTTAITKTIVANSSSLTNSSNPHKNRSNPLGSNEPTGGARETTAI